MGFLETTLHMKPSVSKGSEWSAIETYRPVLSCSWRAVPHCRTQRAVIEQAWALESNACWFGIQIVLLLDILLWTITIAFQASVSPSVQGAQQLLHCFAVKPTALSTELTLGALERFFVNCKRATLAAEADCPGASCLCAKQIADSSHLVPEVFVYLSGFPVLLSGPESLWPQTPSSSGLLHLADHMAATSWVTYLDKAPWERKLCQGRSQLPHWCRKRESS